MSVHFESKDSHPLNESIDEYNSDKSDFETELSLDTVLAKLAKLSADSMAIIPAEIPTSAAEPKQSVTHRELKLLTLQPHHYLPPTRAPPELV